MNRPSDWAVLAILCFLSGLLMALAGLGLVHVLGWDGCR